jgi:hypothetical protein
MTAASHQNRLAGPIVLLTIALAVVATPLLAPVPLCGDTVATHALGLLAAPTVLVVSALRMLARSSSDDTGERPATGHIGGLPRTLVASAIA